MLLGTLERYLNAALEQSTAARDLAASLEGKDLGVRIVGPDLDIVLRSRSSRLGVERGPAEAVDAGVSGTPLALLSVLGATSAGALAEAGVSSHGDAEVLEAFSRMLRLLKPDPEEELAQVAGDVLAHRLFRLAGDVEAWCGKALAALTENASEFLQEESRDVPARQEAEGFFRDIEALRDDAARLLQRVERLGLDTRSAEDHRCGGSG